MSNPIQPSTIHDPYAVKSGDTLSDIARRCGKSTSELTRLNRLRNPDKLEIGQTLDLSERSAHGVTAIFLDALRHPIENLPYRLVYDGKTVQGKTTASGVTPRQVTKKATSSFEVWVQNADRMWQQVTSTVSGQGHKLITLTSGAFTIKDNTELHPYGVPLAPVTPLKPKPATTRVQAPLPPPANGTPSKNNPAIKTRKIKGPQGQSVVEISIDFPKGLTDLFGNYDSQGCNIPEAEWDNTAKGLDCNSAVLKAIAKVESGGRSAFWRINKIEGGFVPAILYERHYFSRLTGKQYDEKYPDISWPVGYRKRDQLGKNDAKMNDGKVDADDIYSSYATSYLRLINAYRLDPSAALKSCSWGKFQVMGANFELCGAKSVEAFVQTMCTSELGQIQLLAGFIMNKSSSWKSMKNKALGKEISLWDAVKTKNWRAIAFNYNGPSYETYGYHTKLEQAYKDFKNKSRD